LADAVLAGAQRLADQGDAESAAAMLKSMEVGGAAEAVRRMNACR
jgi:hypothetical protein